MIKLESTESSFTDVSKYENISEGRLDGRMFIAEKMAISECIKTLKNFQENYLEEYKSGDAESRNDILKGLHSSFCNSLGVNALLKFEPMGDFQMGYHDPETNTVAINDMMLRDSDPKEIIQTDLHEIRHAFQEKAVRMPFSVDVDGATIQQWEGNFANYISPELDFEAYLDQPVEADANNFASIVYDNAFNNKQV